jgi:hypothetical protein
MTDAESEAMAKVEIYQRVVVKPLVDDLKVHISELLQPITQIQALQSQRLDVMEPRVTRLESVQRKTVGAFFGGIVLALSASVAGSLWGWFRNMLR